MLVRHTTLLLIVSLFLIGCDRNTDLMRSILSEDREQFQALLDAGADVNARNNYGWTALMHAARQGDPETVKLLLVKGAQVDLQDDRGWTA